MKINQPRRPIAVIGAGIAGLSAARTLQELGVPHVLLERFDRAGGRLNSRYGEGWVADHGAPYIRTSDQLITTMIRDLGLERERVSIQGGVHRLHANGTITVPPNAGIDLSRVCPAEGFADFTWKLAETVNTQYNKPVGAIRWDNNNKVFWWDREGQVFWFEDEEKEPLRDPVTRQVLVASGVILATTATAAARIADRSPSLVNLRETLHGVQYSSTFAAMFKVPRLNTPWFALQGDRDARFSWIGIEDKKSPNRIEPQFSLVVAHAEPLWSSRLITMDKHAALAEVYMALRNIVEVLPEAPISQTYKRWNVSRVATPPLGTPTPAAATPGHAPFALAGDYVYGSRAEDAAQAGRDAALALVAQLPARRNVLGLELAK